MRRERREEKRIRAGGLYATFCFGIRVVVRDLSLGGVAFETTAPPSLRVPCRLTLRVANRRVVLEGRIVWCRLTGTSRRQDGQVEACYRAGMALSSPPSVTRVPEASDSGHRVGVSELLRSMRS